MATVINNPSNSGGNVGLAVVTIAIIGALALFFLYGLPALRNSNEGASINVPEKIEVEVSR